MMGVNPSVCKTTSVAAMEFELQGFGCYAHHPRTV